MFNAKLSTLTFGTLQIVAALALLPVTLAQPADRPATREIEIIVEGGYKPERIAVQEGERIRLRFVRKDFGPCTREVVFPQLGIRRELPTNKPVIVELPVLSPGAYEFKCGMNMTKGLLVVSTGSSALREAAGQPRRHGVDSALDRFQARARRLHHALQRGGDLSPNRHDGPSRAHAFEPGVQRRTILRDSASELASEVEMGEDRDVGHGELLAQAHAID